MAAPSATSAAPSTTTTTPVSILTILFPFGIWQWDSPEGMEAARVEAAKIPESDSLVILLPADGPAGGRTLSGDLTVTRSTPTRMVNSAGIAFLRWQEGGATLLAQSGLDLETPVTWLAIWEPLRP